MFSLTRHERRRIEDAIKELESYAKFFDERTPDTIGLGEVVFRPVFEIRRIIHDKDIFGKFMVSLYNQKPQVHNMIRNIYENDTKSQFTNSNFWNHLSSFYVSQSQIRLHDKRTALHYAYNVSKVLMAGIGIVTASFGGAVLGTSVIDDVTYEPPRVSNIPASKIDHIYDDLRGRPDRSIDACLRADDPKWMTKDSDLDCLSDSEELRFGSNPNNIDSDGDGLDDNLEINGPYRDFTDPNRSSFVFELGGEFENTSLMYINNLFQHHGIDVKIARSGTTQWKAENSFGVEVVPDKQFEHGVVSDFYGFRLDLNIDNKPDGFNDRVSREVSVILNQLADIFGIDPFDIEYTEHDGNFYTPDFTEEQWRNLKEGGLKKVFDEYKGYQFFSNR